MFEAFFTTKPSGVGTGLGLSVCATIVQDHQGVIFVENDEDLGGARFVMWLPLVSHKEADHSDLEAENTKPDLTVESGSSEVSTAKDRRE